jgi:hypothetical protein
VARSTAQAAIDRLEAAGILLRIRRGLVVAGRWAQVTNAYLFRTPTAWQPTSDTGSRPALESELKPEAEKVLWEGQGPTAPLNATWLQEALARYGLTAAA